MAELQGSLTGGVSSVFFAGSKSAEKLAIESQLGGKINIDTTSPVIQNVNPPSGSPLGPTAAQARQQAVTFEVVDLQPGLATVLLWVKFQNASERLLAYDGFNFVYPFNSPSSVVLPITDGLAFTVLHVSGWPDDIEEMGVRALDLHGNIEGVP